MLPRLTFSNSITFTIINEYSEGAAVHIESVLAHLPCCLSRDPLKRDFLDIFLTTSFDIRNFGNTLAMGLIFLKKYSKFNVNLKNAHKK